MKNYAFEVLKKWVEKNWYDDFGNIKYPNIEQISYGSDFVTADVIINGKKYFYHFDCKTTPYEK